MSYDNLRRSQGDKCRVERSTETTTNGSVVRTWTTLHPSETIALQIRSGTEAVRYGRENNRNFGRAYARPDLEITAEDRIVPIDGDYVGQTFDVQTKLIAGKAHMRHMILDVEQTDP